jgi:hypothetical protein
LIARELVQSLLGVFLCISLACSVPPFGVHFIIKPNS